ncbi:MAG: hypothetical protein IH608_02690 [Proteobacteria bacterium]|nr:hypothetical protein [Pseudomonadota bacterium]
METVGRQIIALLVGTLVGCATVAQFRQGMDAFLGKPIREAQETFGYGYLVRDLENGERAYTWTHVDTGVVPGYEAPTTVETYRTRGDDATTRTTVVSPGTYYPPQYYRNTCEFTFITDPSGAILRWHAQGDGCKGRPEGTVLRSSP